MNGTISQLHKGGGTNKTSGQRPEVFPNSVYQLLNCVIDEWLKRIVEPANILEPGQGGGKQGINVQKVRFIQQEVRRQGRQEFIKSTLTLKTPSMPCLEQRSGRRWRYISDSRCWLIRADM